MNEAYEAAITDGEQAMREWMNGRDPKSLPDSVWECPSDCPLWTMGLSMAQAGGIYAKAKRGGYGPIPVDPSHPQQQTPVPTVTESP